MVAYLSARDVWRLSQLQPNLSPHCPFLSLRRFLFAFVALHCTHSPLGVKWTISLLQNSGSWPVSSRERLDNGHICGLSAYLLSVNKIYRKMFYCTSDKYDHRMQDAVQRKQVALFICESQGEQNVKSCPSFSFYILLSSHVAVCFWTAAMAISSGQKSRK